METRNRKYLRSSGMDGDKSEESGAFLFSRRVPDFCVGRRSIPTNENSKFVSSGTSAMDYTHYQPPELLGSSPPITNKTWCLSRIWDRLLVVIRYIRKIWDGRQKVKYPIVWENGKAGIIPVEELGCTEHQFVHSVFIVLQLPITGCGVNPARSFAPAVLTNTWNEHWVRLSEGS